RNATIFRDCIFTENESTKYGGAIEANDNGVMLFGGTFTGNNAAGKGGAVFNGARGDDRQPRPAWRTACRGLAALRLRRGHVPGRA
ncbi:MAG: hypothetical protein J5600_06295, partial [Desulfovibrio sp.]|nr:hypothetical protein [Desulfovibrio sp.]